MNRLISEKKSWLFFGLLLFSFLPFPGRSQSPNSQMEKLAGQLDSLSGKLPLEIIYIQTSKGIYEPLEDLWFKAYLLNPQTFAPSSMSRTLYLQMFNENTKRVVWQEKYEVQNGFVNGHVYLQDTLSVGDYLLAAYTGSSFFGDSSEMKTVRRIQLRKELKQNYDGWIEPVGLTVPSKNRTIHFITFPEGGNLVAGISNKLAFKAVNSDGTPVDVQGTLFEDTIPLLTFKSSHAGMGSAELTPVAGKKYYIHLLAPVSDSIYILPKVYSKGMSLQLITRDKDFLEFKVSQSPELEKRTVYLRGHIRSIVCCIARGELINELKIKIPLKEFPFQGIAEFTLFDDNLTPLAERLVYVNPDKKLFITTELNKTRYETKGKAILKIAVKDENGQPIVANLGVSVYDKLYQNQADAVNILTHFYLTTQLRGKINDPAYYFDGKNEDRGEALDLLMLTQGWRRYVWDKPVLEASNLKNQQVLFEGVDGEVYVKARVKKAASMQQFVKVSYPNKNEKSDLLLGDDSGKFTVTPEHLKTGQGNYIYLKPMTPEEFDPHISLTDPFQTIDKIRKIKEINYPLSGPRLILKEEAPIDPYVEGHKTIKLAEVTVSARGTNVFRDKYIGHLDSLAKLDLNDDWVCPHGYLHNYREGYAHLVGSSPPYHQCCPDSLKAKPVEGKGYNLVKYEDVGRADGKWILTDKYSVEYHYPKFTEDELLKMNNLSRVKAYYPDRQFYHVKYDDVSNPDQAVDFRNTLFWDPSVITDTNGEATVEFFCSDLNSHFVGVVECANGDGLLGNETFEFAVLKTKSTKLEKGGK
jgi:hypothetical protein